MISVEKSLNSPDEIALLRADLKALIFELKSEKAALKKENEELKGELARLKEENLVLKEQNAWFKKQIFGKKSERFLSESDQLEFPGMEMPEEEEVEQEVKGHTRKQRKSTEEDKLTYPEDLPKETLLLDLTEKEKTCPYTGEPLKKIGEEVSRKLAFKPGSYFIKETIRPKYVSPTHPELGVITAPVPEGIFLKSKVDESLLAHIVTMKFGDHLPLYRIQEILEREGIKISRQTLSYWVVKIGENLSPLYEEMKQKIFKSSTLFVDESPVKLLVKGKKKAHEAYMWIYVGGGGLDPPYRLFQFCLNRRHQNAFFQLKDYQGILHSDKYGAYETLAKQGHLTWCPCWAHIRRYFVEAQGGDQVFRNQVLQKIRYLYMFEKIAKKRSSEERTKIRLEKEGAIIDALIRQIQEKLLKGKHLPKSKYKKALEYFCRLTPYLKNYLFNAEAQIDNNVAERAIRPLAIGRKNWLFVGSEKGGKGAATLLSLVQTCRNLKIHPREYLEDILKRIMSHPATQLEELLPDVWAKTQSLPSSSD